jgi:hypothetical protein
MALANVALTDTFDTQRIRINQIIINLSQNELVTANSFARANVANAFAFQVNANTTAAFSRANTANAFAYQVNANTTAAFTKANTANYYAFLVDANSSAAFLTANTTYTYAANDVMIVANSGFAKANAALPNTSGVTFAGSLNYTGSVNVATIQTHANSGATGSANQVLMSNGSQNYWSPQLRIFDVSGNQIFP